MMIIKGSVELTEDSDRASGQAVMTPKRKHVQGREHDDLDDTYKTGRLLLGNDVIKMMMLICI